MSVWYAIPSARPGGGALQLWRDRGYWLAVSIDKGHECGITPNILQTVTPYPGYATAVNSLVRLILKNDPAAEWIVTGGDDVEPDEWCDPRTIARECTKYFDGTFGVMQPTGDRWAGGSIDRICGSPWMGREFCERMYGGNGPLWDGWFHCFVDEELQSVAQGLGVLWQRRDLTHYHRHWARGNNSREVDFDPRGEPEHLKDKNVTLDRDRPLFNQRKMEGFPGHEPLAREIYV